MAATRAGVILIVGYGVWLLGMLGAGDVKLFAALSLSHTDEMLALTIYMSLIGAAISVAYLIARWTSRRAATGCDGVPYGIAIASVFMKTSAGVH